MLKNLGLLILALVVMACLTAETQAFGRRGRSGGGCGSGGSCGSGGGFFRPASACGTGSCGNVVGSAPAFRGGVPVAGFSGVPGGSFANGGSVITFSTIPTFTPSLASPSFTPIASAPSNPAEEDGSPAPVRTRPKTPAAPADGQRVYAEGSDGVLRHVGWMRNGKFQPLREAAGN